MRKLNQKTLENIAIAILQAETEEGLKVNISLKEALHPELYNQYPDAVKQPWKMCKCL